jgi:hypothetical protein
MILGALARAAVVLVALASASPAGAQAQSAERGFFVGVGGGLSLVSEPRVDRSHVGGSLNLRAGWRLGRSTALLLEGSVNGLGSVAPDSVQLSDPVWGRPNVAHFTRTLKTQSLLASVQIAGPGSFYVRPGVGIARHAFMVLRPLSNDGFVEATSWEASPAAALTVGRRVAIPGFPLDVEGVVGWSRGEDSTNPRWSTGLQVARMIRF